MERAATLHKLAQACPPAQREAASRLALKAIVASAQDKSTLPDPVGAVARVRQILGDAPLARANFDVLVNYGAVMLAALTPAGSGERRALRAAWQAVLDQFAQDASLSRSDRLTAVASSALSMASDSSSNPASLSRSAALGMTA